MNAQKSIGMHFLFNSRENCTQRTIENIKLQMIFIRMHFFAHNLT